MAISHINGIEVDAGGGYAITWETPGAASFGGGSGDHTLAYPASIANGDLLIAIVGQKPATANGGGITMPGGWTSIASLTGAGGYGSTVAVDQGNTNVFAFYKIADGSESGNMTFNLSDSSSAIWQMHRLSKAGGTWSAAAATGSDDTGGATYAVSFTSDPGVQAGDYVIVAGIIATNASGGGAFSNPSFSQTGVTFGAISETEVSTSSGNDMAGVFWRADVSAGTGSGNPSLTADLDAASQTDGRGPSMFIRIRAA